MHRNNLRQSASWFGKTPTQEMGPLAGATLGEEFAQNLHQLQGRVKKPRKRSREHLLALRKDNEKS